MTKRSPAWSATGDKISKKRTTKVIKDTATLFDCSTKAFLCGGKISKVL